MSSVGKMCKKHKAKVLTPDGPRRCVAATYPRGEGKPPLVARFGGISLKRDTTAVLQDQVPIRRPRRTELVKRFLADVCEVCGERGNVEVHHIRKLSDLKRSGRKALPDWAKIMMVRRRKTLVLCRSCHTALHAGRPLSQKRSE